MEVREATILDSEAIIEVLKKSLGEARLQKTEEIWFYKHVNNPFGTSFVLVAEENKKIVGVRALMQWQWQQQTQIYSAYRAVDTATLPTHQGKGIFKKLTLNAVSQLQELGKSFIFNTPNEQSKPGYLKMGWEIAGKIKIAVIPVRFYVLHYKKAVCKTGLHCSDIALQQLCAQHNNQMQQTKKVFTPKNVAFLHWRYIENPLQNYTIIGYNNFFIAMYVKRHRYFNELRVSEVIYTNSSEVKKQIKQNIVAYAREHNCMFITLANKALFSIAVFGAFGPVLTLRQLQINKDLYRELKNLKGWQYSIGDLELF